MSNWALILGASTGHGGATAISLAKDRSLPIIIFSILKSSNIIDIIEGKGSYSIIKDSK